MHQSTHFPHFSPQSYYKPHIRFVNTFQSFLEDFRPISVLWIDNKVALDVNRGARSFVRAKITQKVETFF
jgi:hypothetical protein